MLSAARRVLSAPVARATGSHTQRRGFAAFGDPLALNPPKVGSGIEGATQFARNKKTRATAADIAKLKITQFPLIEAGLAFSFAFAALAVITTRVELYLYYKKFGYIYEQGLDVFNVSSTWYNLRKPIDGFAK